MLYIVGTPIGNLQDLSYRQAKTLLTSDIVLAEDTRAAGMLLDRAAGLFHLENRHPKLFSYYLGKEMEKLPEVIRLLEGGKNISLISQAGMPVISDPGYLLIRTVREKGLPFTVIPGPTAAVTALVLSGIKHSSFLFTGFLPKKEAELGRYLHKLAETRKILPDTAFVAYESPLRINRTLGIMAGIWPDASVCVCRELTKIYEEAVYGKPADLATKAFKGEITVVF